MRLYRVQIFATPIGALHMNNSIQRCYVVAAPDMPHARGEAIKAAYLDCDIEHINPRDVLRFSGREVEPVDLELYTVNTGQFYETHKELARSGAPVARWRVHLAHTAVPRYSREIEPAYATATTLDSVAASLKAYYERHIREGWLMKGDRVRYTEAFCTETSTAEAGRIDCARRRGIVENVFGDGKLCTVDWGDFSMQFATDTPSLVREG